MFLDEALTGEQEPSGIRRTNIEDGLSNGPELLAASMELVEHQDESTTLWALGVGEAVVEGIEVAPDVLPERELIGQRDEQCIGKLPSRQRSR